MDLNLVSCFLTSEEMVILIWTRIDQAIEIMILKMTLTLFLTVAYRDHSLSAGGHLDLHYYPCAPDWMIYFEYPP